MQRRASPTRPGAQKPRSETRSRKSVGRVPPLNRLRSPGRRRRCASTGGNRPPRPPAVQREGSRQPTTVGTGASSPTSLATALRACMKRLAGRAPTSMTGPTHGGDGTSSRRLYKIRSLGPVLPSTPAPAGDSHARPLYVPFHPPCKAHLAPPLFLADWVSLPQLPLALPSNNSDGLLRPEG